jgi:LAO/AO transport system kinase
MSGSSRPAHGDAVDAIALAERVKAGEVPAVARLISLLETDDPAGTAALKQLDAAPRQAEIIGITGYPGAGKSTLIAQMTSTYRRQGKKVGILAVDASSPLTGGAILGDRIRMQDQALDAGVFIRSMATRGERSGLARATRDALQVLIAAGYDVILMWPRPWWWWSLRAWVTRYKR